MLVLGLCIMILLWLMVMNLFVSLKVKLKYCFIKMIVILFLFCNCVIIWLICWMILGWIFLVGLLSNKICGWVISVCVMVSCCCWLFDKFLLWWCKNFLRIGNNLKILFGILWLFLGRYVNLFLRFFWIVIRGNILCFCGI